MQISDTQVENFVIQPAQKNSYNAVYWPITNADGKTKPKIQVGSNKQPLRIPFGLTSFGENKNTGRMCLDLLNEKLSYL